MHTPAHSERGGREVAKPFLADLTGRDPLTSMVELGPCLVSDR